eukprot:TRINITY_DN4152_c0_g1_i2.p1 TRINITY_DN4152_c0_g1~~TRINITY_DN4152_c0_g1_i2.p1  ORF type:complete len:215 (-),score=47.17 TRINITY_DN4152_c0_g1_i2:207-782(-)
MAVVTGVLSTVCIAIGGAFILAAHMEDQEARRIAKLKSTTLAEAALSAPSRFPVKFPNVKAVANVRWTSSVEVREEWIQRGNIWKRKTVEEVISRVKKGHLVLVDDDADVEEVKVVVPNKLIDDQVFQMLDEKFEETIPEGGEVNADSGGEGSVSDHKPRTLGVRKLEMLIPADSKMFAVGVLTRRNDGQL